MRRVLLTTISLLALAATAAVAADIPVRARQGAGLSAGRYNWTGFYLGINGGYGWGRSRLERLRRQCRSLRRPGRRDRRLQLAGRRSPWVFGLEGDIDWANIKGGFANAACPTGCETKNNWLGTARGRVGYAMGSGDALRHRRPRVRRRRGQPSGFAGVERHQCRLDGRRRNRSARSPELDREARISPRRSRRRRTAVCVCSCRRNANFHADVVRAGLNYRF